MMIYDNQDATASAPADPMAMSADEFADILKEIQEQPTWRAKAAKEAGASCDCPASSSGISGRSAW